MAASAVLVRHPEPVNNGRSWGSRSRPCVCALVLCALTLSFFTLLALFHLHPWLMYSTPSTYSARHIPGAPDATGKYSFPRLIHHTVRNKSNLSCEEIRILDNWQALNPGYTQHLYDDEDMDAFMLRHYPDLVPIFRSFQTNVERADMWRYLVVYVFGGVYADMDVAALRPISDWNHQNNHDAAVLLGQESADKPVQVNNWVFAAIRGHELFGSMADKIVRGLASEFFEAVNKPNNSSGTYNYRAKIVERTGPLAFSAHVREYLEGKSGLGDMTVNGGSSSGIRILPINAFSLGWATSCFEVKRDYPTALACHGFHGSWKQDFFFAPKLSYHCKQTYRSSKVPA